MPTNNEALKQLVLTMEQMTKTYIDLDVKFASTYSCNYIPFGDPDYVCVNLYGDLILL